MRHFRSQRIYVLGAVRSPGTYALRHNATLLELISEAGGPTPDVGWQAMVVRSSKPETRGHSRLDNGKEPLQGIRIDLEKLLAGEIRQRIAVYGGDTIYLPKRSFFFVSGQVMRPGRYHLERDTTVLKAITLAGGFAKFAAKKHMKVKRLFEGQRREFRVDANALLQAEDVLVVPQSFF